ncbi:hypothetical protein N7495_004221 [Penicillium taxi]|uniref:uncharacterized protein n=1 Tax=Penicillium taxi TaxID=168475 RepID=UPI002545AE8C|nr:uncharacterized protein N7495_004221 [Penicillium taxi]KAJ5899477.1 hypothetical protein N7495_004221 [Penicillium taxi]
MSFPPPAGQQTQLPPRPPASQNGAHSSAYRGNTPYGRGNAPGFVHPAAHSHHALPIGPQRPIGPSQPYPAFNQPNFNQPGSAGYAAYVAPTINSYPGAPSYGEKPAVTYGPVNPYGPAAPLRPTVHQTLIGPVPPTSLAPTDRETEALEIAQWQSAYSEDPPEKPVTPPRVETRHNKRSLIAVKRTGGGKNWIDETLVEWDPAHFRLFVGNLSGEVTDEMLHKSFSQYPTLVKARVVREKRTTQSKEYGFVSFSDADDYFRAFNEMQKKYIGNHPITLRKAKADVKPVRVWANYKGKDERYAGNVQNAANIAEKEARVKARAQAQAQAQAKTDRTPMPLVVPKVKHDGVKKSKKTKNGMKLLG